MLNQPNNIMNFDRQANILPPLRVRDTNISLIGAGSIGSFSALALCKMGIGTMVVYDFDRVEQHNLPNQFYRTNDLTLQKVNALHSIIYRFAGMEIQRVNAAYQDSPLQEIVVVATDSMSSRKLVWEQFKKQSQCKHLIEARMGGELGIVYAISRNAKGKINKADIKMYEDCLHTDAESAELPCGERSIIYNVLMISSLICKAVKSKIMEEPFNRETIFSMNNMFYQTRP